MIVELQWNRLLNTIQTETQRKRGRKGRGEEEGKREVEEGEEVGKEGGRRKRRRKKIQYPRDVAIIYNLKRKRIIRSREEKDGK